MTGKTKLSEAESLTPEFFANPSLCNWIRQRIKRREPDFYLCLSCGKMVRGSTNKRCPIPARALQEKDV